MRRPAQHRLAARRPCTQRFDQGSRAPRAEARLDRRANRERSVRRRRSRAVRYGMPEAGSTTLIDTHCHLDPQYFPAGPDEALARAAAAGIRGFVVIGVGQDLAPARAAVALAKRLS